MALPGTERSRVKGSGLTAAQWAGLGQGKSGCSPDSGVSADFALSQPPSAQLTNYRSLDKELISLRLNFFCEVRIKLVYPKGTQALIGMI